jgi:hypothetical protein
MLVLDNTFNYPIRIAPKTAAGNPAAVDGRPAWSSTNPDAFTVQVADDGLSALIVTADSGTELRTGKLQVRADADLGEGVSEIFLEVDVVVGPAPATSLSFEVGEAVPKVAAPAA